MDLHNMISQQAKESVQSLSHEELIEKYAEAAVKVVALRQCNVLLEGKISSLEHQIKEMQQ